MRQYFAGTGDGVAITSDPGQAYAISFIPGEPLDKAEHEDEAQVMANLLQLVTGHMWQYRDGKVGFYLYYDQTNM